MPKPTQNKAKKPQAIVSEASSKHARAFEPGLYLVSTPIGNMGDIGSRALEVLRAADLIVCEDTRVTGKLLALCGLPAKKKEKKEKPERPAKKKGAKGEKATESEGASGLLSYNEHNAPRRRRPVLKALQAGKLVALVSDAGTPLLSDPGYKLVQAVLESGGYVTSVPGANAVLPALQLSGLPADRFCFLGFLPPKTAARKTFLSKWAAAPATLVMYETGARVLDALADIGQTLGTRRIALVRELTKLHEQVVRADDPLALRKIYQAGGPPKGELVLVVEGAAAAQGQEDGHGFGSGLTQQQVKDLLAYALQRMSVRDAAFLVSEAAGRPKKEIYNLALDMTAKQGPNPPPNPSPNPSPGSDPASKSKSRTDQ